MEFMSSCWLGCTLIAEPGRARSSELGELPDQRRGGQGALCYGTLERVQGDTRLKSEHVGAQCVQRELVIMGARRREGTDVRFEFGPGCQLAGGPLWQ